MDNQELVRSNKINSLETFLFARDSYVFHIIMYCNKVATVEIVSEVHFGI